MKNSQRGFIFPLIIIVIAVVALGVGYFYYKNQQTTPAVTVQAEATTTAASTSNSPTVQNNTGIKAVVQTTIPQPTTTSNSSVNKPLSVTTYINNSQNPPAINNDASFTISWSSTGVVQCSAGV